MLYQYVFVLFIDAMTQQLFYFLSDLQQWCPYCYFQNVAKWVQGIMKTQPVHFSHQLLSWISYRLVTLKVFRNFWYDRKQCTGLHTYSLNMALWSPCCHAANANLPNFTKICDCYHVSFTMIQCTHVHVNAIKCPSETTSHTSGLTTHCFCASFHDLGMVSGPL